MSREVGRNSSPTLEAGDFLLKKVKNLGNGSAISSIWQKDPINKLTNDKILYILWIYSIVMDYINVLNVQKMHVVY